MPTMLRRIKTSIRDEDRDGDTVLPRIQAEEQEPVTPAGRLFLQPDFYLTAQCIAGFQNPIDLPSFKRRLADTFAKHPRFSSVLGLNERGREVWVRTTVNIDEHVFTVDLSDRFPRGSSTVVEDYAAELSTIRLDPCKPLWQVHVLRTEGVEQSSILCGDRCRGVCVLVFHHALGDGTSLMSLFLASTRQLEHPDLLPTIPKASCSSRRPAASDLTSLLSSSFYRLQLSLWKVMVVSWFSLTEIVKFLCMQAFLRDNSTCLQGYPGAEKEPSRLAVVHFKLDDLKRVKNAARATVNDVLAALVSIALQKYLRQHDSGIGIQSLRIRALVLVNTRPSPGLQELKEMMNHGSKARWGNSLGYMLVPLSVNNTTSSPLDHVRCASLITTRKKLSYEAKFTYSAGDLLSKIVGVKAGLDMTYRTTLQTTLTISNIVGPVEAVTFAGNPLLYMIPTSGGLPQGLILHMTSYLNDVKVALMVKPSIVPDLTFLKECFENALDTLLQSI